MTAPDHSRKRQIPLAPRAPSIHGTSDNGGCGSCCRQWRCDRKPRWCSAQRARRGPPCGSPRSRSLPSSAYGRGDPGWHDAKRSRDRGRYLRSPGLDGPISPPSTSAGPSSEQAASVDRAGSTHRAASCSRRGHSARSCRASNGTADTTHTDHLSTLLKVKEVLRRIC